MFNEQTHRIASGLNIPSFHFTKRQKHACNQKFSSISLN